MSDFRLAEQPFNNCPGREVLRDRLNAAGIFKEYHIADAPKEFWDNAEDTIVLKKNYGSMPTLGQGIKLGQISLDCGADEMHSETIDGDIYVRIWWD
jgi:hypothetical protein